MSRGDLCHWMKGAVLAGELSASAIDVDVATAKSSYYPGEELEVLITVANPATLFFGSSLQTLYTMDGVYTPNLVGAAVLTDATTPRTWTNTHRWHDYNLSVSDHTVVGTVIGYGTSGPAAFNVVPPPVPQGDFLIDFDTIPGTTARVAHLMAYAACGVRFHTRQGTACSLQVGESNSWVEGFDPYPNGFHVIADFAMPVFGASAKVAGGTGVRITMIARNAQGQTLATDVSAPVMQPGKFVQTLSVTTTEPIASLEWSPSIPNSMAGVDDLFVITGPSLSHALLGSTLELTWPTVSGANYQLWSSTNLETWTTFGPLRAGTGSVLTSEISVDGTSARFFRVSKVN